QAVVFGGKPTDQAYNFDTFSVGYTFPAADPLTSAPDADLVPQPTRVGFLADAGATVRVDDVALTESEQWYRFGTLGDGRIGDQIQLRIGSGTETAASRPQGAVQYSTSTAAALTYPYPPQQQGVSDALRRSGLATAA